MNILDVGCGSGVWQDVTKRRGQINFDILKPQEKIKDFVLGDANHLPFKNGAFQKTFFVDVIEHVENPAQCLRELQRVTREKIIVGTPNAVWLPKTLRAFFKGNYKVFHEHIATYGIPELTHLFNRVGFKDFSIKAVTYKENRKRNRVNILVQLVLRLVPSCLGGRQLLAEIVLKRIKLGVF